MKKRPAAIPFILVTILIDVLGLGLLIPVLPELVTELAGGGVSTGSAYFGWFIAVYAAMQFLFAPVLGALSDRYGRRPVILVSLLGSGIDFLLMALSPTLALLFVGRVISGITGANITAANAYIADVSAPEDRAKNFGLVGAVFGVGFILGPALGGVLGNYGLRLPFFAAAALALLNWLYGYFILPESHAKENRAPFRLRQANPLGSLAGLRRYPIVAGLAFTYVCAGLAQQALQSTWVLYTSARYGWSPLQNGLSLMLVGILAAVVQGGLVRVLIPRMGEARALLASLALGTVTFALYGLATHGWMLVAALFLGSLGGLAGPAAQGLISRAVSAREQGAVQGSLASLMSLTGVVGPVVATYVFAAFTAPSARIALPGAAFFLGSALMLVGLIAAARLFYRRPAAVAGA